MLTFEWIAIEASQSYQRHTVNMGPAHVRIKFPQLRVAMKKVEAMQVMVGNDPVAMVANSLLHQQIEFRQRPGLERHP